jgi:hypothetical protein
MSKQLSQCPYCTGCVISLNDRFEVVFNPDTLAQAPCVHLIWAHGGCSQWERTAQGTSRVIGSTTIHWCHPDLAASVSSESLFPYMGMLAESGKGWEFAPAELFEIQGISEEGKALDPQGKEFTAWEADGWAVFACSPKHFLAAIHECQANQSGVWQKAAEQQTTAAAGPT